jgi:hypothetical protein
MAIVDVVRRYERVLLDIALHDHQILVNDGRTANAPFIIRIIEPARIQAAEILLPQQLAIGVVTIETLRTKKCHHVLPVGCRCCRGLTGFRMSLGLRNSFVRDFLPDDLAGALVETINTPAVFDTSGEGSTSP